MTAPPHRREPGGGGPTAAPAARDLAVQDRTVRYRVTGMDCAHDAAEIEQAARAVAGVESARVSVASQRLTARVADAAALPGVEHAVAHLGYQLDRLRDAEGTNAPTGAADGDADELPAEGLRPIAPGYAPAYRRALWIVVALNLGYGVVEAVGGFLSGSQALKADALDFLGDGLISFLGLLAIGWSLRWRARAALLQGMFLGSLGVGVLGSTAYRVLARQSPEAELMGAFGGIALVVNVAAALVLIPHRMGDANARAVWLFSRNDAIGNLAVVVAAGLVAWTGTPWPDLVVAVVIAGLFLHSAWTIVRDARADLGEVNVSG